MELKGLEYSSKGNTIQDKSYEMIQVYFGKWLHRCNFCKIVWNGENLFLILNILKVYLGEAHSGQGKTATTTHGFTKSRTKIKV